MTKLLPDFKQGNSFKESWYDLREDWPLIEASLAKQYGVRIRKHTDMPWTEFCTLVGGLMPDTPLGQIVTIRSEKDPKVIKQFTPDQRRIHSDWKRHVATKKLDSPDKLKKEMDNLSRALAVMFGKKEVK